MQVGAVLRAEKTVRSAPPLRNFSARKCANSLQILCTADAQRTKTSAGVAAKNILMLQDFCVEFLARAMPKTRASSDRTCAKFC